MSDIAILTRPLGSNDALAQRLRAAGWQVRDWPALALATLPAGSGQLPLPQHFDLAVFVSGNAARHYLAQLRQSGQGGNRSWPVSCAVATVGPASAATLRASGAFDGATLIHPGPDAPSHDSEALWDELRRRGPLPGRVLIVRGTQGRDWLAEQLRGAGVEVVPHAAYHRAPAQWGDAELAQLRAWRDQALRPTWLLTSGEGIAAVLDNVVRAGVLPWWRGCRFIVTHPALARRMAGQEAVAEAAISVQVPDNDALFEAFVSAC
ncbi:MULTISPECIES: uroporphyrinogen-III synthase [unclassified Achromobacter]|uniref:uroporphyrinogen-III synthase n=1 Tax=unclassified Achromobacter TaxID=2626865 RepID=UPI000B515747|nr:MULTISPECIES: uroporphyrinogen-III synthase [unclassified Achromobacter]OWT77201.1 uroporphyrinogen-III synthase [Achromobacter sp. HZ28]OWT78082.1 uroporphyrinogen-III synthase [Achromobacter sp. HZ34]